MSVNSTLRYLYLVLRLHFVDADMPCYVLLLDSDCRRDPHHCVDATLPCLEEMRGDTGRYAASPCLE